jgi:hypothetical protein
MGAHDYMPDEVWHCLYNALDRHGLVDAATELASHLRSARGWLIFAAVSVGSAACFVEKVVGNPPPALSA